MASREYVMAQFVLLGTVEGASRGSNAWPSAQDYARVVSLGRMANEALRRYLDSVGVARKRNTRADRLLLIQRLSAQERLWQPTPEDWLRSHGRD